MTNIQNILSIWALLLAIIWGSPTGTGTSTIPTVTASSTPTGMVIKAPHATITVIMDDATTTPDASTTPEVMKTVPMTPGPAGTSVVEPATETYSAPAENYPTGGYNIPKGVYTNN